MNKLTRISATVASSLALVAGFTGVAGAASINDTGRDSNNRVTYRENQRTRVNNRTDVRVQNTTNQDALSGNVTVEDNDDVDAEVASGVAWNDNTTSVGVGVDNSTSSQAAMSTNSSGSGWSGWEASISDTGRDSQNEIRYRVSSSTTVNNNTEVQIQNETNQVAFSGDVNVENNDDVDGSVSSGEAANQNSSSFEVYVKN